jgi:hypothetical protein
MDEENSKLKVAFLGGGLDSVVGSAHYSAINVESHGHARGTLGDKIQISFDLNPVFLANVL